VREGEGEREELGVEGSDESGEGGGEWEWGGGGMEGVGGGLGWVDRVQVGQDQVGV